MKNAITPAVKRKNDFVFFIFMAIIVESDIFTVVIIDARSGNNRSAKIPSDIFGYSLRVTFVWFSINIESIFVFAITF